MPKRKRTNTRKKAKKIALSEKIAERWMLAIAIAIVFVTIFLLSPKIDIAELYENDKTQQPAEIGSNEFACKGNTECFLASCKITPSDAECVNVLEQETYYQNCQAYWDVDIVQDFTRCACVDEICKLIR